MIDGKFLNIGYLQTAGQTIFTKGNVQYDAITALASIDAGIGVQRTFSIPDPSIASALNDVGLGLQAERDAWLNMLDDLDDISMVIAKLEEAWGHMSLTAPAIKVIPTVQVDATLSGNENIYSEGNPNEMDADPAMVFRSQSFVESTRAVNEKREVACHIIARFLNEALPAFPNNGNVYFTPATWTHPTRARPTVVTSQRRGVRPTGLLADVIEQVYQNLDTKTYIERLTAPETEMIIAMRYLNNVIPTLQVVENGFVLDDVQIMLLLEAINYLQPALSSQYHVVMPLTPGVTSMDCDTLHANMGAAEKIFGMLQRRHSWTPLCTRYRVESMRGYWSLSFTPMVRRIDYDVQLAGADPNQGLDIMGMPLGFMMPTVYEGGAAELLMDPADSPTYPGNGAPTFYRTTRDAQYLVSTWDTSIDISQDPDASADFHDLEACMVDRITARNYGQQNQDGATACDFALELFQSGRGFSRVQQEHGRTVAPILIPGSRINNAGNIEAFGLTGGYSIDIPEHDDVHRSSEVCVPWIQEVYNNLDYNLKPVFGALPSPFNAL